MKKSKRTRLERAGWKVGSAEDFLELSREEVALVEMRLALAGGVRKRRQARRLTQTQVARKIGSSQSRVAKMEAGDPSVSIDLMVKALLALGTSRAQVARIMAQKVRRAA